MKEWFQSEREKLKSKTARQRVQYIWDYYKFFIIGFFVAVILLGSVIRHYLYNNQEEILYISAVNTTGITDEDSFEMFLEEYQEYQKIDPAKEKVTLDTTVFLGSSMSDADYMNSYTKLLAVLSARQLDIIIADEESFSECASDMMFAELKEILPQPVLEQLEPYLHAGDESGSQEYGIRVESAGFIQESDMFAYEPVLLGVVVNSRHEEEAVRFIEYLLTQLE